MTPRRSERVRKEPWRSTLIVSLKFLISLVSLWLVGHSIDWAEVAAVFARFDFFWALVGLAVFWCAQVISSLRCVYIARAIGGQLDLKTSVRAHFVGLWFNQLLPTSLGGDVVKIAILTDKLGLSLAFRAAVLDRFSGLAYLMLAIIVALPLYDTVFAAVDGLAFALGALAGLFAVVVLVLSWAARRDLGKLQTIAGLREIIQLLRDVASFSVASRLWEQFWTSSIVHFNGIAAYALLALAMGLHVDALTFILVVPIVFLVALLPLSVAGWGVREAGAVWLFGIVGIPKEQSLAISVCFGLLLITAGLPGLLAFAGSKRVRMSVPN